MPRSEISNPFETFGLDVEVLDVHQGPVIFRWIVKLGAGVSLEEVTSCLDSISQLSGDENGYVVSDTNNGIVTLDIPRKPRLGSSFWTELEDYRAELTRPLSVFMGRNIDNDLVTADLAEMPHLLVAGNANHSGKAQFIHGVLCSILERMDPHYVRVLLIDSPPRKFDAYSQIPHHIRPIVTDHHEAMVALKRVADEVDGRNHMFGDHGVQNIAEFNQGIKNETIDHYPLPLLLVVISELSRLMAADKETLESEIRRISAAGDTAGVHLLVATRDASEDVLTPAIKECFPSRLALTMRDKTASEATVGSGGAENLLGQGDALFLPRGASKPVRVQGVLTEIDDIEIATGHWSGVEAEENDVAVDLSLLERVRQTTESADNFSTYMVEKTFNVDYLTAVAAIKSLSLQVDA